MGTTVTVGGVAVTVSDGTLEIEQAIEERSTCRFTVVDREGALRFHTGQRVIVTDDVTGETLFGGVIETPDEREIRDAGGLFHEITAVDWHYLADKRIAATSYENRTAGEIVGDLVGTYLAAEGVRGGPLSERWDTETDWQAGTFVGTMATEAGDVELGRAGMDVSRSEDTFAEFSAGTLAGVRADSGGNDLRLALAGAPTFARITAGYGRDGTQVAAGTPRYEPAVIDQGVLVEEGYLEWQFTMSGSFIYVDLASVPDYTIQPGDVLHYDVLWHDVGNCQIAFDMSGPLGNLRDSGATDQHGRGVHPTTDLSSVAFQRWYHREISLAPLAGKTMDAFMVACERDFGGNVSAAVRNIAITDGAGNVRKVIWKNGDGAPSTAVIASDGGSSFFMTRVVGESLTIPAAAMPGSAGTVEFFMVPATEHYAPRVGGGSAGDTYWNLLSWGDILSNGFIVRRGVTGGTNVLEFLQFEAGAGIMTYASARTFVEGSPYHLAVAWDGVNTRVYVNGMQVIQSAAPMVIPASSSLLLGRSGFRQPGATFDDLRVSRVKRTAAEIAARWNGGFPAMAPIDKDTTYKLAFDGSLAAGQGGYRIAPALDLSATARAGASTVAWAASVPAGTSLMVETSIDGGSTWQIPQNAGAIPGLTPGMDTTGVLLLVRATLETDDNASTPQLDSLLATVESGYVTAGTWESEPVAVDQAARFAGGTVTGTATTPAGTAVTYETSGDGGATWQATGAGGEILSFAEGDDLTGRAVMVRAILSGDGGDTPRLHDLTVTVKSATVADGPTIGGAVFNYIPVSEAIGRVAERAGFWWVIDPDRILWFQPRDANAAPWVIADADIQCGSATASEANPKYRNRQFLVGAQVKTDPQTETIAGDGETRAFTVGFPMAEEPSQIRVFRAGGAIETFGPDQIGVKGVEQGKAWYWSKGDPVITQDDAQAVVGATERVEVTYRGQFQIVVVSDDPEAIAQRQALEGIGTGRVEVVDDAPSVTTQQDAFDTAGAMLRKWAEIGRTFRFTTRRGGLMPGQLATVDQPEFGFDGTEVLITGVTIREDYAGLAYEVEAASGPASGSWASVFGAIAAAAQGYIERLSNNRNETVIVAAPFTEAWAWAEASGVTVNACLSPAGEVYPDAGAYPC